ncbi:HEPN domain-containing protein [Pseudomonas faucium]|uniref:HEPN domain-containing protein n=1 Tax=Pseudomonas faucium TaxID=2740518 RepID=UPI001596420A|nr:HEPN domain-containing protein [Pseudomonas faucium]
MFSYSFAIKLTDRSILASSSPAVFEFDSKDIKIEQKEDDVFLVSSEGYATEQEALEQLVTLLMKVKVTLLKLKIPHEDWLSFSTGQRFATSVVGSFFEKANIVPLSFQPQAYESSRHQHWPGAKAVAEAFVLATLTDIILPASSFNYDTVRILEALSVLGLALASTHAKSKLILSMTAIEVLSDRGEVDQEIKDALDALKGQINLIKATDATKDVLAKMLESAKRETISKAGKRVVKEYLGGRQAKEFYRLYDVRSELVHGNLSRLTFDIDGHSEVEKDAEIGFNLALQLALKFQDEAPSDVSQETAEQ